MALDFLYSDLTVIYDFCPIYMVIYPLWQTRLLFGWGKWFSMDRGGCEVSEFNFESISELKVFKIYLYSSYRLSEVFNLGNRK